MILKRGGEQMIRWLRLEQILKKGDCLLFLHLLLFVIQQEFELGEQDTRKHRLAKQMLKKGS